MGCVNYSEGKPEMDIEQELLRPPSSAPLSAELIYRSLPTLVGGPLHGEAVPISLMNRNHIQLPVSPGPTYHEESDVTSTFETAMYVRGKFASQGSRRVLDVWSHVGLSEDERSALTWLVILERADLA